MEMVMTKGEREDFQRLQKQVDGIEQKINKIFDLVKGIAIGLLIGGVIFGIIKFKDVIDVVK